MTRFSFRFTTAYRLAAFVFGVRPDTAYVEVADGTLNARFGPWSVTTPARNVTGTEMGGPYKKLTTIGPAHLSFADRGLTFATNPDRGLCIRFAEPVSGIDPFRRIRHPALTVTVEDPERLQGLLAEVGMK